LLERCKRRRSRVGRPAVAGCHASKLRSEAADPGVGYVPAEICEFLVDALEGHVYGCACGAWYERAGFRAVVFGRERV
jgi:hypothetical protein